jgi:chitinase
MSKIRLHNDTISHLRRYSLYIQHANENISPYRPSLKARVYGPIQYGSIQPCLDEACCSKKGKCAHKAAQCAPENCLSNCDTKAMCGIESADGKTPFGQFMLFLLRLVGNREHELQGPGACH